MTQRRPTFFGPGARRAEKYMVPWESVNKNKVYERDGWVCVYCGQEVFCRYLGTDGLTATVDHVVPISLGGAHMYSNLVTSCDNCNQDKGNDPDLVDISYLLLAVA